MRDESDTEQDHSPGVASQTPWHVVEVTPLAGLRLAVRFADGVHGEVDLSKLILGPRAGVFEQLRDPARFAEVGIDRGAVCWPGELDLAPDAMHDEIEMNGRYVVE